MRGRQKILRRRSFSCISSWGQLLQCRTQLALHQQRQLRERWATGRHGGVLLRTRLAFPSCVQGLPTGWAATLQCGSQQRIEGCLDACPVLQQSQRVREGREWGDVACWILPGDRRAA